jgi:hypothetical protein
VFSRYPPPFPLVFFSYLVTTLNNIRICWGQIYEKNLSRCVVRLVPNCGSFSLARKAVPVPGKAITLY